MGPIQLRKGGLVHRWWRFCGAEADVCSLAKKTFLIAMLFAILAGLLGVLVWTLVIAPILKFGLVVYLRWAAGVVGLAGMFVGIGYGISRARKGEIGEVVNVWIAVKKGRYCPIIEFVEDGRKEGRGGRS
jgi:hypothetical protein